MKTGRTRFQQRFHPRWAHHEVVRSPPIRRDDQPGRPRDEGAGDTIGPAGESDARGTRGIRSGAVGGVVRRDRSFHDDETLQNVPYAVDDAVDLAYVFALDPRVALVRPNRVALALSDGNPRKEISKRRLVELKRNGAIVVVASQAQILKLLSRQAGLVGGRWNLHRLVCHAWVQRRGRPYLLTASSLLRELNTAIPMARVLDLVAASTAARSLMLVDTCRERVRKQRSTVPESLSAAPLIQRMGLTAGQVVLYGAAAGRWAYDDDLRQNGVFTEAVLLARGIVI